MIRNFLIVAGGSGSRMGSAVPKQFLEIGGKPVLLWTLEKAFALLPESRIILVLPVHEIPLWEEICRNRNVRIPHQTVKGGIDRFHSVKNGLLMIDPAGNGLTAVHDGVRPFFSARLLENLTNTARENGNAIPVLAVQESMRKRKGDQSHVVSREDYLLVQTPQIFATSSLVLAYRQKFLPGFTDDATVVEKTGEIIHFVPGEKENIKITTPIDLLFAEALLRKENGSQPSRDLLLL